MPSLDVAAAQHAARHAAGGPDPLTPEMIGAATKHPLVSGQSFGMPVESGSLVRHADDETTPGVYRINGGTMTGGAGWPWTYATSGTLVVMTSVSSSYLIQTLYSANTNAVWTRASSVNGGWLPWQALGAVRGGGQPGGVVTAPVGTEYIDLNATAGARKWYKASGTGNTGWIVTEGDTGWVNLVAEPNFDMNAPGTSWNRVKRTPDTVFIALSGAGLDGFAKGDPVVALPKWAVPDTMTYMPPGYTGPSLTLAGGSLRAHQSGPWSTGRWQWAFPASTTASWPTSL